MLKIITHPNEILRKKAKELDVSKIKSKKNQELIDEMIETMEEKDGIGLAAPQINKSIQIIVVKEKSKVFVFINPKITSKSWLKTELEEGCLSLPGIYCLIKRSKRIKFKALDRFGEKINLKADNLFAKVVQHEIDHLNGILIIDKNKKCEKPPQM